MDGRLAEVTGMDGRLAEVTGMDGQLAEDCVRLHQTWEEDGWKSGLKS